MLEVIPSLPQVVYFYKYETLPEDRPHLEAVLQKWHQSGVMKDHDIRFFHFRHLCSILRQMTPEQRSRVLGEA